MVPAERSIAAKKNRLNVGAYTRPSSNNKWQVLLVPAILVLVFLVLGMLYRHNSHRAKKAFSRDPYGNELDDALLPADTSPKPAGFILPAIHKNDEIARHFAFTLCYSEENEEAKWVAYMLTGEMASATGKWQGDFRPDPAVITGSATPEDYKSSGYDRGHLCPAADMKWSPKAQSECFLMSNMTPQLHAFNAGIWEDLEKDVRKWAKVNSRVYVVTGPVLEKGLPKIGPDGVSIPRYFYKVVLDADEPDVKEIAFIIPNKEATDSLWNYAVTVRDVEKRTGIDFFPLLPDTLEKRLESGLNLAPWKKTAVHKRAKAE
jgi:endonuclease G